MTGLEKIIQEIRNEAAAEAKELTDHAQAERQRILNEAKVESDLRCEKIAAQAAHEAAEVERSCASALELQRRQRLLDAKQKLLSETIDQAQKALQELPDAEYFALLLKMVARYAEKGEGNLLLSDNDLARLPGNFEQSLQAALPPEAKITISKDARPVNGGFVLKYGDVEENCSFAALFDARRDELADRIVPILFG